MEIKDLEQFNITNTIIFDSFCKMISEYNKHNKIVCSISGGGDSDIVCDICSKVDINKKIIYVFFDTGLEYNATKNHLRYLEVKYGIDIIRINAVKPIPLCNKIYGQPFLSKTVSEMIMRLQRHDFKWEDRPFDELIKEYPKCKSALQWWCDEKGNNSMFNISRNKYLKEFMIENPPTFAISNKCCYYAKKLPAKKFYKEYGADLSIIGIRKAEGGARAGAYKNCFTQKENSTDEYRPIFWYVNSDKLDYEKTFDITHSKCYTEYGLKRTGCCGCVFGRNFEFELKVLEQYEPKLFKAVNNIFKDSYEYTRKYRKFVEDKNKQKGK